MIFVFIMLLAVTRTTPTHGLAGILNRVRSKSIMGKSKNTNSNGRPNSLLPVQVTIDNQASAEQSSSLILPFNSKAISYFDADTYRQEMTDLVYQRSMQRMISS